MSASVDQISSDDLSGRHRRELASPPARANDPRALDGPSLAVVGRSPYSDKVMWLVVAVVAAVSTALSVPRYIRVDPATWDLGIFTEAVRQYSRFHAPIVDIKAPGFNLLGDHFHPLLAILAPAFWIFPSPVTLLVLQAILTAISVVPVYIAAAEKLGVPKARAISAAYGLSWGLAAMNSYDFHEICLAVPLLAFALSALVRGRFTAAALWAAPLVLVKEDQGFTVAAIGLVIVLTARHRWRTGALLVYLAIASSVLEVYVLIPHFNSTHVYPYWVDEGHLSSIAVGLGVKLPTLIITLLPTAFMAVRSPVAAVAIPSLALRFTSSNNQFWGTGEHYSATLMPILFVAAVDGIYLATTRSRSGPVGSAWRSVADHVPAMMAVACVALAFQSPLDALWTPSSYQVSPRAHSADHAMSLIPSGTTVEASLDELAPLAIRDDVFWWSNRAPQWILFDQASPEWNVTPTFIATRHGGVSYRIVYNKDGVWLFERSA